MRIKAVLVCVFVLNSVDAFAGAKQSAVVKEDAVKDDVTIVQADTFLTDIKWLLNVTQFHPEREMFGKSGADSIHRFFLEEYYGKFGAEKENYANAFEKSRAEEKLKSDLAMTIEESKKATRLPIPLIELDAAFEVDDTKYSNGCYRPWVVPTKVLNRNRSPIILTKTAPVNYFGFDIPAKDVKVEFDNNQAAICVPANEAEKLFLERQSISTGYEDGRRVVQGYAGKAYYKISQICNTLTKDFAKGTRTGIQFQLVAFKVFDASGNQIYPLPKNDIKNNKGKT